jgi:hypothetical protein
VVAAERKQGAQVVDVDEAALVGEARERQRPAGVDPAREAAQVARRAGPWRAAGGRRPIRHAAVSAAARSAAFGIELGRPYGVVGAGGALLARGRPARSTTRSRRSS